MNTITASPVYTALLTNVPPRVIRSDEQNEAYIEALHALDERAEDWSADEAEYAALLTLLIEDYEAKRYDLPKTSPVEALAFLMEQHGLKQKDLIDVFGSANIVSEVMGGKRELNKEQIRRLSERFAVSVELFF